MNKLVSIITPAHNCSATIARTINSVLLQTYTNWEIIVVDDGSIDNTVKVLEEFKEKDSRIKYYINQENIGSARTRNRAIEISKGHYIAFLDSDDTWLPTKLEDQILFMELTGNLFTYGSYDVIDKRTETIIKTVTPPQQLDYNDLLKRCPIGCLTAVYNQQELGKLYMPNVRSGQDWGLWLALTRQGVKAYKYPGVSARYYVGTNSLSSNKLKKSLSIFKIYREHEKLSLISTCKYLVLHTINVLKKKRVK